MKTILSGLLTLTFLSVSASAQLLLVEDFDYPDGNLVTVSGGLWTRHSGTLNDSMVQGHKYQIDQSRADDVDRQFTNTSGGNLYLSFIANFSIPPSGATYFAHLMNHTNTFQYVNRVFAIGTNSVVPGTFRLGIAGQGGSPDKIFPVDLATNVDYQVVCSWDTFNLSGTLWINPTSESSDPRVASGDIVTNTLELNAVSFRQENGEGALTVSKLRLGNNFADVLTNTPVGPGIVVQPAGTTNFTGANVSLYSLAAGSGALSYQWYKDGAILSDTAVISGSAGNVLNLADVTSADIGNYQVVANNTWGYATSQVARLVVTAPVPPFFTNQLAAAYTNTLTSPFSLTAGVDGSGPFTFTWYHDDTSLPTQTGAKLSITALSAGDAGDYYLHVLTPYGETNSRTFRLYVVPSIPTTIGHLRSLNNTNTWTPTDTTTIWQARGTVISYTNTTSSGSASFYIQDNTGGINVFVSGWNKTNTPPAGALVSVTAPLSQYNNLLELVPSTGTPGFVTIVSTNNPMPPSTSFNDFAFSNQLADSLLEGMLITVTNVSIQGGGGGATFASGNWVITNQTGQTFILYANAYVGIVGQPKPAFAYEVTGVLGRYKTAALSGVNCYGYELLPTRYADIVTTLPAPFSVSASRDETTESLSWPSVPGSTYSVWSAGTLPGPWTRLAFGLNFLGAAGQFIDTNAVPPTQFYRVSSP